jgi:hypothetical protein
MAKNEKTEIPSRALAPNIMPGDVQALAERMLSDGYAEEKTFSIGDPTGPGSKKVPVYWGELIGEGGTVEVDAPGGEVDPATGKVKKSLLAVYLFNPIHPESGEPVRQRIDNIIATSQVAAACKKYGALAALQKGNARLFFRWNGKTTTRKGNQMNDYDVIFKVAPSKVVDSEAV